jgi:hypothetical protein
MAQQLYTQEIIANLRSSIWTSLQASLSLKVCQVGDISYYTAAEDLLTLSPGIFIKPGAVKSKLRNTNLGYYEIVYDFRVVYIRTYKENEAVISDKLSAITTLAGHFYTNAALTSLTLANAKIVHCLPSGVEYDPPEDGFLAAIGSRLTAGTVNLQVLTYTAGP